MAKQIDDITKIKSVFMRLDTEHKKEARLKISQKFGITQESVNNRWIYEGEIPHANIPGVAKIIKAVARKQIRQLTKVYDCI